ncbi:MAG: hypothetical protein AAF519_11950 [Bacteroidota bacterium]
MMKAQRLLLDQVISSKTHGNTVEYGCINPELTGKCIKYHNDQWYTFVADSSNLFVNISGQSCRDLFGVQLVIFSGELCRPETYQLIDCISLATQDDIYVELNGLIRGEGYWLNIDGYLHDFCTFELEVSHLPKGFSTEKVDLIEEVSLLEIKNELTINWKLPDSLAHLSSATQVYRRTESEFKYQQIADVPFQVNAYGIMQTNYSYTDIVFEPGTYHYRLALPLNDERVEVLDQISWTVQYSSLQSVNLDLDYEYDDALEVTIADPDTGKELDSFGLIYKPKEHRSFPIYITKYAEGFKALEVRIHNKDNNHTVYHYIDLKLMKAVKLR